MKAAELEILYTANTDQVEQAEKRVKESGEKLEKKPITAKIDADDKGAIAGMARVETEAKQMVSRFDKLMHNPFKLDMETSMAQANVAAAEDSVAALQKRAAAGLNVEVELSAAQEKLERARGTLEDLVAKRPDLKIGVDGLPELADAEEKLKQIVGIDTVIALDVRLEKSEAQLARAKKNLEELRALGASGMEVKADTARAEAQVQRLERSVSGLKASRESIELDADGQAAMAEFARVESGAKRLVSKPYLARLDADIKHAEGQVARFEVQLDQLRREQPSVKVLAEVDRAESQLKSFRSKLEGLNAERAVVEVQVETDMSDVADDATAAGDEAGKNLGGSIIAALATIPIAGAVVGIAKAGADAFVETFQSALQVEVKQDRLQALTGIDESRARLLARLSGEAYTQGFGESIEQNMDTSRLALQFDLIDADTSNREAQKVIEGLSGIAGVLDEDVRPTAAAVATMLRTGLAGSAQEAFDVLAAGARNGVNLAEDMLDTYNEYPALFQKLGLSGAESMGLMSQSLKAGARNSDFVADALKEFQIRATDASEASAEGFRKLNLDATDMTAKIARGGTDAREGLSQVLTSLRETEDPLLRNAAALALFGTKAEDLGDALFAMDLSTAVEQLGTVEGAAEKMFSTLQNNDASNVEQAMRNIEVAAEGIKGALAGGFSGALTEFADWVSQNRGPLMEFFSDLISGAFDFGISMVESAAAGTESFGEFVSGPLATLVDGLVTVIDIANKFRAPWDQIDTSDLTGLADDMRGFDETTAATAAQIRTISPALESVKEKVGGLMDEATSIGYLNDASRALADSVGGVGFAADGTKLSLDGMAMGNLTATEAGAQLDAQMRSAVGALNDELAAALAAGEGQAALTERYQAGTDAIMQQLVQMGLTEDQAWALIGTYDTMPGSKTTKLEDNALERTAVIDGLRVKITQLPDKSVRIETETNEAETNFNNFISRISGKRVHVATSFAGGLTQHDGGLVEFMHDGGIRGTTPMAPIAQMVSPNTWRIVGDRGDVDEAYIPMDGSARSLAILAEVIRRMPGAFRMMSEGGLLGGSSASPGVAASGRDVHLSQSFTIAADVQDYRPLAREVAKESVALITEGLGFV